MIPFDRLCCTDEIRAAFEREAGSERDLGRVTSLDRGYPMVNTRNEELRAELATTLKKAEEGIVTVGDWVVLRIPPDHDKGIIEKVLPRRTEIARIKRVGRDRQVRRQVLAANVDRVLICQSLTGDGVDLRLLTRQMVAVCGCGAQPVFVLTKSDLVDTEVADEAAAAVAALAPDVPSHVISSYADEDTERIRALCPVSTTSLLLGESGVGKSSLVNALLGSEAFETGSVRSVDDKGRHTTVARRMVEVPGGGLIIDAPGLRTLQIIDMPGSLAAAFPDIISAARGCHFNDCTHTHEPGCAVRGKVSDVRLEAYLDLARHG